MNKNFKDYLLSEYSHIAEAHFKSIETISTFFRYYLLLMSIPTSAIVIFSQKGIESFNIIKQYSLLIATLLFSISIIGIGVFLYITSLRLDVISYARVVNGIRKYFYVEEKLDINLKSRMRILPQSPQLPSYFEKSFFLPVVFVFAVINTFYSSLAYYIFSYSYFIKNSFSMILSTVWFTLAILIIIFLIIGRRSFFLSLILIVFTSVSFWGDNLLVSIIIFTLSFILLHFEFYKYYTHHRETEYLRSNILGVDIDGVLNEHREHFCRLLFKKTGKKIDPQKITVIPVHEHPTLGIEKEEESKVFNSPEYWTEMPPMLDAQNEIEKLRNAFKFKIYIFSYRPWPEPFNKKDIISYRKNLVLYMKDFLKNYKKTFMDIIFEVMICLPIIRKVTFSKKEFLLNRITKQWLKNNDFKYDKFYLEKGNEHSSDPRGEFNNRFYIAREKKIRFFVEDDMEKAIKLSYVCDIVFLFDQPYNKKRTGIPTNIIRVKSWKEIYKNIRKIS